MAANGCNGSGAGALNVPGSYSGTLLPKQHALGLDGLSRIDAQYQIGEDAISNGFAQHASGLMFQFVTKL